MWSTCALVDLLGDKKHSENALSAPVSPTINWTFVREDNSGRLRSLNSFPDGLTWTHIRLCCHLICRASSSLLANFLGQLLHVQGKGRSPVKKEDHQWIEIPRKFSLTIDIVSNFWGQYCLKKGASQPGLLCNSYCDWPISSKLRLHNWDIHLQIWVCSLEGDVYYT